MIYASSAWVINKSKSNLKNMETVQSSTLRKIFDFPWFVNNQGISAIITPIEDIISTNSEKLKQTIIASQFTHINNIAMRNTSTYPPKHNRPINF